MQTLVLDVYSWRISREETLASIGHQIDEVIGRKSTGCIIVTLDGPMDGDAVQLKTKDLPKCPTCESIDKESRRLVALPGDEYCPNMQWDRCKDDWHDTQETQV